MAILIDRPVFEGRQTANYHRISSFPPIKNCVGDQGIHVKFDSYTDEAEYRAGLRSPADSFAVPVIVNKQEYMLSEETFLGYLYTKAMLAPEFEGAARD